MRAPATAGLLVAVLLVAGCLGGPSEVSSAATDAAGPPSLSDAPVTLPGDAVAATMGAQPPVWNVGDAWATTAFDDEGTQQGWFVVTRADADGYTTETTSERLAGFDAMFDVSYLGRLRADLAGSQNGVPVQFFSFPLEDGKSWTTGWDGREVALTATKAADRFLITGTMEGEPYVEYDYVPSLRWWSKIEFAAGYGFRVDTATTNWTGTLATATGELLYESETALPVATLNSGAFTVTEGASFAALTLVGGGPAWARALVLTDPAGAPYMTSTPNVEFAEAPSGFFYHEQLPATPGQWHIGAPAVHEPGGWFRVQVHQVTLGSKAFP